MTGIRITFDTFDFVEGESRNGLMRHSTTCCNLQNHMGWHLAPHVHEWFVKSNIKYYLSADWEEHFCFYLTLESDDDAVLAMMRWMKTIP